MSVRRIEGYDQLTPLLSAQMKRGMVTNALLSGGDLRREIAAGALWVHEWDGGLLLLRRREAGWRMNFYLRDMDRPSGFRPDGPVASEVALRPRDTNLSRAIDFWQSEGFSILFRRKRLALPPGARAQAGPFPVRASRPGDRAQVREILTACFDPLTGCCPDDAGLERALAEGRFLLALAPDGAAAGLLHIQPERQGTQLRHLAVAEPFRGQGAAQSLLAAYLERTEGRSQVWVREDNHPACRFYEKNGYRPDEWTSAVLRRL